MSYRINTYPRNSKFRGNSQGLYHMHRSCNHKPCSRNLKTKTIIDRSFPCFETRDFLLSIDHSWQVIQYSNSDHIDFFVDPDLLSARQLLELSKQFEIDTARELISIEIWDRDDFSRIDSSERGNIVSQCLYPEFQGRTDLVEIADTGISYDENGTALGVLAVLRINNNVLANNINRKLIKHELHTGYSELYFERQEREYA